MSDKRNNFKHRYFILELTKSCQNSCIFCYNVWKEVDDYPKEELASREIITLLEKTIEESGCEFIALTGGEPLLKEGVFDIASFISASGVTPILISNGKLLSKDIAEKCLESGIKFFELSLHSHKRAIHDRLVGRGGNFEEVLDAIINVRQLGGKVSTVFVATRENIAAFDEFVELNALLRVNSILFNRVACGGACLPNWTSLAPSPSQLQQAFDDGAGLAEKYKIGLSAGVQLQPCLIDVSRYESVATAFCPLNNPQSTNTYFTIDPAGNLRMCNRSRIILGNLLEESLEDIMQNREIENFCRAIPEFCIGCKLAGTCAGGCKADAISCFGTLTKPDPFLEMWKAEADKIV